MFRQSWWLIPHFQVTKGATAVAAIAAIASQGAYAKWARKVTRSIYCALGEANSTATDAIGNIRTVRGFSTDPWQIIRKSHGI